jgi:DNA-binding response OmpR family regulator
MAEPRSVSLSGRRLLVVEDDYMIAADLASALQEYGAHVIGPAGSIENAMDLLAADYSIDGAVLDLNLRGKRSYPVADALRAREVPFIFATGYDAWTIPDVYADVPRVEKPVNTRALAQLFSEKVTRSTAPQDQTTQSKR